MPILNILTSQAGLTGVSPALVYISTTDTQNEILAAGYLNQAVNSGLYSFSLPSMCCVTTTSTGAAPYDVGWYELQYSAGSWSLITTTSPGDVVLPTTANHIATYTNVDGTLGEDPATAITGGNLQAGLSGTAGYVASFPGTASKGSLHLTAVANTGNTTTTISNAAMGQASVVTIPDPAAATADFVVAPSALVSGNAVKASGTAGLVVDSGYAFHAGTTGAYAGGGTSNAFTVTGMASTWIVTATILTQTNAATIVKAVPTSNTLTVTFSADPGASTTVSWIASTASV